MVGDSDKDMGSIHDNNVIGMYTDGDVESISNVIGRYTDKDMGSIHNNNVIGR